MPTPLRKMGPKRGAAPRLAKLRLPKRKAQDYDGEDPEVFSSARRARYSGSEDGDDEGEVNNNHNDFRKPKGARVVHSDSENEVDQIAREMRSSKKDEMDPRGREGKSTGKTSKRNDRNNNKDGDPTPKTTKTKRFDNETDNKLSPTESALNRLLSASCNISLASPIYISFEPEGLSQFCREFETILTETAPSLIEHRKEATFYVKAVLLPGIRITQSDKETLLIQIYRQTVQDDIADDEVERKLLFSSLFTSCGSRGTAQRKGVGGHIRQLEFEDDDFTAKNLPVVIWYGKTRTWDILCPCLERQLQCNFQNIHITHVHMQIFAGIWLHQDVKRGWFSSGQKNSDGVSIDYHHSKKSQKENKVFNVELNFGQWKNDLEHVEYDLENNLPFKQALKKIWQEVLDAHLATYKDDLSKADFIKIRTSSCVISANGRIKLRKGTKLSEFQAVFSQLTRMLELGSTGGTMYQRTQGAQIQEKS